MNNSTTSKLNPIGHNEANALIPEFINGVLRSDKSQAVQEHIAQCEVCSAECQTERLLKEQLEKVEGPLEDILSSSRRNSNLNRLMEKIDEGEQGHAVNRQRRSVGFGHLLSAWRNVPDPFRVAAYAQTCALLLCIGLLVASGTEPPVQEYRTYTDSSNVPVALVGEGHGYHIIRMVFHPKASEADVRQLLLDTEGQITSGPSLSGVYTIAVGSDASREEVLQALRSSPWVEFAEPVVDLSRQ